MNTFHLSFVSYVNLLLRSVSTLIFIISIDYICVTLLFLLA